MKKSKQGVYGNGKCDQNDYDEIKFWYNKQVDELAKDRWFDDLELPMRLMDELSKMNEGGRDEFMWWSESEKLTCKVRTLVRYYKIHLTKAAG